MDGVQGTASGLPFDLDAEASVLGAVLIDNDAIVKISDKLHVSDFYDIRHQYIYEAIRTLYEDRKAIDVLTLSNQLKAAKRMQDVGGASYLTQLTNFVPTAAHVESYAELVAEKSVRRQLLRINKDLAALAMDETKKLKDLIEITETELMKVGQDQIKQNVVSLETILESSFERLDALHHDKKKIRGIPTGYKDLDNMLAGLQRSDLFVLAARPSMGKAQPLDAHILTTNGWKQMRDIAYGDQLASVDSQPSRVTGVYPQGTKEIYAVTFSDGRSAQATDEHLWKVYYSEWPTPQILTTSEVAKKLAYKRYQKRLWIDTYAGEFGTTSHLHKNAPRADRLALLQGLLDTGGRVEQHGTIRFATISETLADVVLDLARSLGAWASKKGKNSTYTHKGERIQGQPTFVVTIAHPDGSTLFTLPAKKSQASSAGKRGRRLTFASIQLTKQALAQCIQVSHPSQLYITDNYVVTHNTALALNLAHNVGLGAKEPVLYFSLEMSKDQLADRLLSMESGVDAWALRTGNLTDADFEKIGQALGPLGEAPIYIDDTPGITVSDVRTKARREAHLHPLGLIIVDYLQLMSGGGRYSDGNRVQEISEISRGLKGIARELNVPLIALSQLSRSVENRPDKQPQLADLRESGAIEQDADIVAFIYREEYYNPETDRKKITDILVKKHRNGPTGTVSLYFDNERQRFRSLEASHTEKDPFAS